MPDQDFPRWEYMEGVYRNITEANDLGRDGWELVGIESHPTQNAWWCVFKRQLR